MRDRNLIRHFLIEGTILESGLKRSERTTFLSENPNEVCNRLSLIIQEGGNDSHRFDGEIVAISDKSLEYNCITPTQHRKIEPNFHL